MTDFYLWVAFGGFLGGALNGFLAPAFLPGIVEYEIVLALAVVVIEWRVFQSTVSIFKAQSWNGLKVRDFLIVALVSAAAALYLIESKDLQMVALNAVLLMTSLTAAAYAVGARRGAHAVVSVAFLVYLATSIAAQFDRGVYSGRTFFGAFHVDDHVEDDTAYRRFLHGTTLHGIQAKDPEMALTIQSYYGNLAEVIWPRLQGRDSMTIGVTGLGAGTLACLGRNIDQVTFFEIDPAVEHVARSYFTYLEDCPPRTDVILGDARLSLLDVDQGAFDLLILDAFSSDSVPVHLLTNEAAELYEHVLKDDGLMAFHISNRYLDLTPVLKSLADHRNWTAWVVSSPKDEDQPLQRPSTFVLVAKGASNSAVFKDLDGIEPLVGRHGFRLWTDDYSNLLSLLRL